MGRRRGFLGLLDQMGVLFGVASSVTADDGDVGLAAGLVVSDEAGVVVDGGDPSLPILTCCSGSDDARFLLGTAIPIFALLSSSATRQHSTAATPASSSPSVC